MKIPKAQTLLVIAITLSLHTTEGRWRTLIKLLLNLKPRQTPVTFNPRQMIANPRPITALAPNTLRSRDNWLAQLRFNRFRREILRPLERQRQSRLSRWRQTRRTKAQQQRRQQSLKKYVY